MSNIIDMNIKIAEWALNVCTSIIIFSFTKLPLAILTYVTAFLSIIMIIICIFILPITIIVIQHLIIKFKEEK